MTSAGCFLSLVLSLGFLSVVSAQEDSTAAYWMKLGRSEIESLLSQERNEGVARNVILFIGDGMGMSTITAGRIFKGQLDGHKGEENFLSFEKFKNTGLLKTYNVDRQVPDSAGTATALFTGIKANYYTVGFDATVTFNVCRSDVESRAKVDSIITWAIEAGKSTGVVTTTRVTHATPASSYAHSANRDWECDSKIPVEERKGCKDISRQFVEDEPGRSINVVMGGGEQTFRSNIARNDTGVCFREDGLDLIWEWMKYQKKEKRKYLYVSDRNGLNGVDHSAVDYLLGIFGPGNLPYDKERTVEPSLEEMTTKAIQILSRNSKGFVLIVEGGRIDHAHHHNLAEIAMEEMVAFDRAVAKALDMTDSKETLVVVTADHSHAFVMNGYPRRGNPITGFGDTTPEGYHYQTLSYTNGPGYTHHRLQGLGSPPGSASSSNPSSTLNTWRNLTDAEVNRTTPHMAGFWTDYETHGGEDVPVYASGPMAHLFPGVHEQTHVAFSAAYSACIGPYYKSCKDSGRVPTPATSRPNQKGAAASLKGYWGSTFLILLAMFLN